MGWAKDMLFLGGYLSPAVLAEEIELEHAAQAAEAARRIVAAPARTPAAPASRPVRANDMSARPCA